MRTMKDSGIEWIGEIPIDWIIVKLKNIKDSIPYAIVDGPFGTAISTNDYVDEGVPLIRIVNIKQPGMTDENLTFITEEHADSLTRSSIHRGDIVFAKTGATVGKCAINDKFDYGIMSSSCVKISISADYDNRFYYYFFYTDQFQNELRNACAGTTRDTINLQPFSNLKTVMPSFKEQKRIADYLEKKCAQIDSVIVNYEKMIEKLREYKISRINELVVCDDGTKCNLGLISTMKNGLNFSDTSEGNSIRFLGVGNFKDYFFLSEEEQFSTIIIENEVQDDYLLKDGDIVFVRSNGSKDLVGRAVMVRNIDFPLTYSGFCIRYRNIRKDLIDDEFLLYYFRGAHFRKLLEKYSQGSNINNMNQDLLSNMTFVIPSMEHQKKAVEEIRKLNSRVDLRISQTEKMLDRLVEYKKSLIYEVVTGKKEV